MLYITVDGDNVGQKISSCYLLNDATQLREVNNTIQSKVKIVADLLKSEGFDVIFCAADGVAGCLDRNNYKTAELYSEICNLAAPDMTFSAGTGRSLREAYIALLYAKSSGKARLCDIGDLK